MAKGKTKGADSLFGGDAPGSHPPTEQVAHRDKDAEAEATLKKVKEESPRRIRQMALAKPFPVSAIKWKPQSVKNNRCAAVAYIDARLVMDRLDDVCGVDGWSDKYKLLPDGSVLCKLSIWVFASGQEPVKITKCDVGSPSEQPDGGDRLKAACSDALKRAAVKFGVGRYIYRLVPQWVDYDPVKRQIVRVPQLPAFAIPKAETAEERVEYHDLDGNVVESDATPPMKGDKLPERPAQNTGGAIAREGSKGDREKFNAREQEALAKAKLDEEKQRAKAEASEPKDATLEKWKSYWKEILHDCSDAQTLTNVVKERLRKETPKQFHGAIWEYILLAAGSVEWNWKPELNKFVDERTDAPY